MIDVGNPYSRPFQSLVESLTDSLQLGVEQPGTLELLYRNGTTAYPLRGAGPVSGLAPQIAGFVGGKPAIFTREQQYRYAAGQLIWLPLPAVVDPDVEAGWFPDDNTRLTVDYYYRDLPSGVTDYNAGSVAGTLVRAMSREFKLLYEQMDQAYRRAFIDYAQGAALDNVVALLGIARNPALPAEGEVSFLLKKAPARDLPIAVGTRVADARGRLFKVSQPGLIPAKPVDEAVTAVGKLVQTAETIAALVHVRISGSAVDLATVVTAAGKPFGDDERTITLANVPASAKLVVSYQPKSATVHVIATDTGPEGNLGSGSLTVMPTPPRGVDGGVTNREPLSGGEAAETDEQLRERAKHALERAGNATLNAIRYAVLNVDGVESVEVRDFSVDPAIPLGEVWVRYASGQPDKIEDAVNAVVDATRAAGIKARVEAVRTVLLSGSFFVIPEVGGGSTQSQSAYRDSVLVALKALAIGEPVSARKLASRVFQIAGLADVAEAQLYYKRDDDPAKPVEGDPFLLAAEEQARPDEGAISVLLLQALTVANAALAANGTLSLKLQALDGSGAPITFRNTQVAVIATVFGKPLSAPTQPLAQVAQVSGTATFLASNLSTPTFAKAVIPDLGSLDKASLTVSVQAAAYPGIRAGSGPLAS